MNPKIHINPLPTNFLQTDSIFHILLYRTSTIPPAASFIFNNPLFPWSISYKSPIIDDISNWLLFRANKAWVSSILVPPSSFLNPPRWINYVTITSNTQLYSWQDISFILSQLLASDDELTKSCAPLPPFSKPILKADCSKKNTSSAKFQMGSSGPWMEIINMESII